MLPSRQVSALYPNDPQKALAEGDEAVARQVGRGKDIISILSKFSVDFQFGSLLIKFDSQ